MAAAHSQSMTLEKLDDLAVLDVPTLREYYLRGHVPALAALDGDLRGRMLAVPGAGRIWFALIRAFASWRYFPWRGKSFSVSSSATRGAGINRVFGDRAPRRWFRFETFVGPSRADAGQAFQLDYDNSDNPFFIRAIKDEVRQVALQLDGSSK